MKALLLVSLLAQAPAPVPALPRFDAHAVAGWQNLHKPQPQAYYNDWLNAIFYGGAGVGWYWNEHLKTQVDFGGGTRDQQYETEQFIVNGQPVYASSRAEIRETNVSIGQQYQFFHNQWFHPHAGAGIEVAQETITRDYLAVTVYDSATRTSRLLAAEHATGPVHSVIVRPFAEVGFKAYMSRRAFFLGDMRVMVRGGIDEVLFRAGFGIDF